MRVVNQIDYRGQVELFPAAGRPVTSTMPFLISTILLAARVSQSLKVGGFVGITRMTIACVPRCLKMLTRKRASPGALKERSAEPTSPDFQPVLVVADNYFCDARGVRRRELFQARKLDWQELPASSICGGRPGEKIKSLTLSELFSISRSTAMKFSCEEAPP